MKNKIVTVLMMFALAFSLSACALNPLLPSRNSRSETTAEIEDVELEVEDELDTEDEEETSEEEVEEVIVERGTIDGMLYQNASLKLSCSLQGDWSYLDDEQITEITGIAQELLSDDDLNDSLTDGSVLTDMYAISPDRAATIMVSVEKADGILKFASTKTIADAAIITFKSQFEESGYTIDTVERLNGTIDDQDVEGIHYSGTANGMQMFGKQLYLKEGDCVIAITLTSFNSDATTEFEQYFHFM